MSVVVAVAGHVDHGKSAVVAALTGATTDRLVHEAAAGHTIEVHPVHVPDTDVTLLDGPGHVDWLAATVAAMGAASHAVLVVAADDGVMPQTRDHVVAIRALGLPTAALVVTKSDRAPAGRPAQVARDARRLLAAPQVPVCEVDGRTGDGAADLRDVLAACRPAPAAAPVVGPDLWLDRSFVVRGRGRVVTGTLRRGAVAVGDELVEATTATSVRVRGLQSRGVEVDVVDTGARAALRVTAPTDPPRGGRLVGRAIADAGLLGPRVDVWVTNLSDHPLTARGAWTVHAGTLHRGADLRPWQPVPVGGAGPATLVPDDSLPLRPGDRVVLRDTGRRRVVAAALALSPSGRRRGRAEPLADLADALHRDDRAAIRDRLAAAHARGAAGADTVVPPPPATPPAPDGQRRRAAARLAAARDALAATFEAAGWTPPPAGVLLEQHGLDRSDRNHLVREGRLHVAGRFTFAATAVRAAADCLATLPPGFSVADARDALGISRRHTVPLLELLDRLGVTRADADLRREVLDPDRTP